MKFVDTSTNRERRFAIGREADSGRYYLSIPVSNQLVDYEEYYELSSEAHDAYPDNIDALAAFADKCRQRLCDHLLMVKPGRDRGAG